MRIVILLTILVVGFIPGNAQETEHADKGWGVSLGLTGYQVQDEILNPLRHKGSFVSVSVFHRKHTPAHIREFHGDFIFNPLKSRFESEVNSAASNVAVNYQFLWKLTGPGAGPDFFLGPVTGIQNHLGYYNWWDESHIYWLTAYYSGIDARLTYRISDKSDAFFNVEFPLVALVSRPPERFLYKQLNPEFSWIIDRLHDNLKLTSVNHHLSVETHLEYRTRYSEKVSQGVFWRFFIVRNTLPGTKDIHLLSHTLGTRLYF